MRFEAVLPSLHEQALADSGAGLILSQERRTDFETEASHAETDRSGGDDDDFGAAGTQVGDLRADRGDSDGIELTDAGGQDAGAQFDHDPFRGAVE